MERFVRVCWSCANYDRKRILLPRTQFKENKTRKIISFFSLLWFLFNLAVAQFRWKWICFSLSLAMDIYRITIICALTCFLVALRIFMYFISRSFSLSMKIVDDFVSSVIFSCVLLCTRFYYRWDMFFFWYRCMRESSTHQQTSTTHRNPIESGPFSCRPK